MSRKNTRRPDTNEVREDLLRPSNRLGYDRDSIGMHLLACEAFEAAEVLFRRAIWLNPFEPAFKQHLAWCLFRQKRYREALSWVEEALAQDPGSAPCRRMRGQILQGMDDAGGSREG